MTTQSQQAEASSTDMANNLAAKEPASAEDVASAEAVGSSHGYREWLVFGALAVAMIVQLWTSVVQLSITSDEVDHLHAAYRYWQCNDFGWNPEHPPLVKIVAGLPLQFMHINDPILRPCGALNNKEVDFRAGHQFIFSNPETMLTAARFAVSLYAALLLVAVWFFARKMFGLPVAVIGGVLIAFEPNLLAHGALVTTDMAGALGILLAVYALYCYATEPNFSRLLALGLATGFALCAKHSTILLAVVFPAVLAADAMLSGRDGRGRRLLRYAGTLLIALAVAIVVLWAAYGFRYAARPGGAAVWTPPRLVVVHGTVATKIIPQLERWHVAPEAYLVGLQDVLVESEVGRTSFLLGKFYLTGNWFYFPVVPVIKFTLPFLLMVLVSALSLRFWRDNLRKLFYLLLPVVIYFSFSMTSKLNMGIRHLSPVLPLLAIFAAAGVWNIVRGRRWIMVGLVAVLAFHAATSLHAYPNYLCYSNELWGGPTETYRYLANSDVDWGQAQKMARAYIDEMHPSNCFSLRTYASLNSDYGIPCGGISELQWDLAETPFTGTMIVSSTMVDGVGDRAVSAEVRRIFKDLKPSAKLGGSALLVYNGTFDLGPIVAVQLLAKARKLGDLGPENERGVLELAQRASKLDPLNGDAHVVMCASYDALGQMDRAEQECNLGLELVRKDPQYGPQQVKYLEDFITRKGLRIYSASKPQ